MTGQRNVVLEVNESFCLGNVCTVEDLWDKAGVIIPEHILLIKPRITLVGRESQTKGYGQVNSKPVKYEQLNFTDGNSQPDLILRIPGFNCNVSKAALTGIS